MAARQRGNTNTSSLIALKPDGCDTARVRGNSNIHIYPVAGYSGPGGYVQVNSDCGTNTADDDCTTSSQGSLNINGTATLEAPKVNTHGGCTGKTNQPIGPLDEAAAQIGDPLGSLAFPSWDTSAPGARCGVGAATTTSGGSQGCGNTGGRINWGISPDAACPGLPSGYKCVELDPGVYYGGWDIGTKIRVTLKPGIYVIAGGGISIGATGSLDSLAGASAPAPILLFSTDNPVYASSCPGAGATKCQGSMDITAGADLKLAGLLGDQPCPPVTTSGGCPYGGMVIWYDGRGSQSANASGEVDIEGGVNMLISGTIYAPRAYVNLRGQRERELRTHREAGGIGPDHLVDVGYRRHRRPVHAVRPDEALQARPAGPRPLGARRIGRAILREAQRQLRRLARVARAMDRWAAHALVGVEPPGAERHHVPALAQRQPDLRQRAMPRRRPPARRRRRSPPRGCAPRRGRSRSGW